jgi:cyclophilin family peptidyl-prolyl cis-trans isomerase
VSSSFRSRSHRHSVSSEPRRAPAFVEHLEGRVFLHSGPLQVAGVVADNRGEIIITMNQAIRASNANTGAIQMYTPGPDGVLATADDTRVTTQLNYQPTGSRIIVRSAVPADTGYRVKLVSNRIETPDGDVSLDGEFSGAFPSGNGSQLPGGTKDGNFEFQVKNDKSTRPLLRWSTSEGVITTRFLKDVAPGHYSNFRAYADSGEYDNSFFTRNVPGFIIQGGSLRINDANTVVEPTPRAAIQNEFSRSNTRGTLAMAKQGNNPNSATNQFFFNLADNSQNLDNQNGGFTVFAEVTSASGLAVMDAVAGRSVVALHNPNTGNGQLPNFAATGLTDVPVNKPTTEFTGANEVVNPQTNEQRFVVTAGLDPSEDLIVIRRVAQLMLIRPV